MSNMPTSFNDPEGTRSLAADGKSLSEDLKSKISAGMTRIKGLESSAPWGNDEPGRSFAGEGKEEGYVPASNGYQENAPKAGDAAVGAFQAVMSTVDELTGVDTKNKTTIDKSVST
jgi:hypothetical protein